jgi:hypothetical protein
MNSNRVLTGLSERNEQGWSAQVEYQINLFHDLVGTLHVVAIATSLFRDLLQATAAP